MEDLYRPPLSTSIYGVGESCPLAAPSPHVPHSGNQDAYIPVPSYSINYPSTGMTRTPATSTLHASGGGSGSGCGPGPTLGSGAAQVTSSGPSLLPSTVLVSDGSRNGTVADPSRSRFAYSGASKDGCALSTLPPLPSSSLSVPPPSAVPAESLEQSTSFASAEEFELMVGDLRRVFISWLKQTEGELGRERMDLIRRKREFEEEKKKVWALFHQDRAAEYAKLKEERKNAQAEMAAQLKQLQVERQDARAKLNVERNKFAEEKEIQRRQALLERERFRQEYAAFDAERQRIVDSNIATETVVDLNVGGVVFETARQTLVQQPGSFLEALLSGRHQVSRDRQGRLFLDRDAELFRIILNFLRNSGTPPEPRDGAESDAITHEANYYGLHFFPFPLVYAVGGHDGSKHLRSVEVLDYAKECWRPCKAMQTERTYFGCSSFLNRIYIYGGQNLDYKALCDVEVYDCLRDTWQPGATLNVPRRNSCGVYAAGRHFAIGGFDGSRILDSVECYDPRMKSWVPTASLNCPRSSAMCCVQGDSVVVLGGTKGERLRTVEAYDQRMDKWEVWPCEMIEVRSAGCAVSSANHIYVVGGTDNAHQVHSSAEVLDPELRQWRFLKPMTHPSMDCAGVAFKDTILVCGGQDSEVFRDCSIYRHDTGEWTSGPSMMSPRYGHGLLVCPI